MAIFWQNIKRDSSKISWFWGKRWRKYSKDVIPPPRTKLVPCAYENDFISCFTLFTTFTFHHSPHDLSFCNLHQHLKSFIAKWAIYRVAQKKRNSQYGRFFRTLLWSTVIFLTLLDRASSCHYINTKIIKFGWELFILWAISYGLSSSGFAQFSWVSRHDDKLMANPENDSP